MTFESLGDCLSCASPDFVITPENYSDADLNAIAPLITPVFPFSLQLACLYFKFSSASCDTVPSHVLIVCGHVVITAVLGLCFFYSIFYRFSLILTRIVCL